MTGTSLRMWRISVSVARGRIEAGSPACLLVDSDEWAKVEHTARSAVKQFPTNLPGSHGVDAVRPGAVDSNRWRRYISRVPNVADDWSLPSRIQDLRPCTLSYGRRRCRRRCRAR